MIGLGLLSSSALAGDDVEQTDNPVVEELGTKAYDDAKSNINYGETVGTKVDMGSDAIGLVIDNKSLFAVTGGYADDGLRYSHVIVNFDGQANSGDFCVDYPQDAPTLNGSFKDENALFYIKSTSSVAEAFHAAACMTIHLDPLPTTPQPPRMKPRLSP